MYSVICFTGYFDPYFIAAVKYNFHLNRKSLL